jgi:hypothetical protein
MLQIIVKLKNELEMCVATLHSPTCEHTLSMNALLFEVKVKKKMIDKSSGILKIILTRLFRTTIIIDRRSARSCSSFFSFD